MTRLHQMPNGVLPDLALLEMFGFYVAESKSICEWHTLIHVCRRWRDVILHSPLRLKLQLECIPRKPLNKTLEVWPRIPIVINGEYYSESNFDNITAMLKHNDRVSGINLRVLSSLLSDNIMRAMQEPFPMLTSLRLCFANKTTSTVPADAESFLGGSAESLQSLSLEGIPFPGLPVLLLNATHLVHLNLSNIPQSGYFQPISIVAGLSALTRLESFVLKFESHRYCPDRYWRLRLPGPWNRTELRSLTSFSFKGTCEYLDDLVGRIDAPRLADFHITFFNDLVFHTPELAQFIGRTRSFNLNARNEACVQFYGSCVSVTLPQVNSHRLHLGVSCRPSDWQLGSMAQVCASSFPRFLIHMVKRLYVDGSFGLRWQDDIDKSQWLEFLQPFTSVKDLYLSWKFVPHVAPALQELVEEGVAVLPALQSIFWEGLNPSGPVMKALDKLAEARQHPNHPIAVSHWDRAGHVVGGR